MLHLFHHTTVELCFRAAFLAVAVLPFAGIARAERKERRAFLKLADSPQPVEAPSVAYRTIRAKVYASSDHPAKL